MGYWLEVADFLLTKRCFEAKKTGNCNCRALPKRACTVAQEMAASCNNMADRCLASHTPEDIYKLVSWKRCGLSRRGRSCNHKACIWAERLLDVINQNKAA